MKKRWKLWLVLIGAGLFIALNVAAYCHAWRMTHFVSAGTKTRPVAAMSAVEKLVVLGSGVTVPKCVNSSTLKLPSRMVSLTTRDGVRLEAQEVPAANGRGTVILFHGYGTGKSVLHGETEVWHALGYRCLLVDFRGSGGSDGMVTTLGWREALDVQAAAAWVGEPAILYGQSMGAAAVLRAVAVEGVKPAGIVVEAPFDRLVTTVGHRYETMRLPSWPLAQVLTFWGGRQQGFNAFDLNPVEYARAVQCPALVLQGAEDPWVKVPAARAVADAMNGHGTLHVFAGVGHCAYVWEKPAEYRQVVSGWLAKW
jgi:pimeloyl-ACP methyl ester carboxylesterase